MSDLQFGSGNRLFGDPADFAIEVGLDRFSRPVGGVWGHMCVGCGGVALADIRNTHCALYVARCAFADECERVDELWDESLRTVPETHRFDFFDGYLFGCHGDLPWGDERSDDEVYADAARYNRFGFLTNWGESFDGFTAFVVAEPGEPLTILYRLPDGRRGVARVTRAGFAAAAPAFTTWFDEEERRDRSADSAPA